MPGFRPQTPLSAFDLLQKAAEAGLRVVQFGDNLPLHTLSADERAALSRQARQLGLRLEVGTRRLTPDNLNAYLSIARQLGSPFLRMVIDDADYHPGENEVIRTINECLPALREQQIILALENHDRFPAASLERIIRATDPDGVGICLDSVNSLGADEGSREVLRILAPYTVNFHVKDFTIRRVEHKMGFVVEGCPAGQGLLDIPETLAELARHGRCRTATLEVWSNPEPTIEATVARETRWVQQSLEYLKPLFDQKNMTTITLVGAGGKMGCRLTDNFLKYSHYQVHYLEVSERGIDNLASRGVTVSRQKDVIPLSDVVILAVPDVTIGSISEGIIPHMKPGALVLTLDPAAPLDGVIAHRDDLGYVIAHPCHPSIFNWEPTEAAFRDFYGGISAKQSIVVALMHGTEEHYQLGEKVSQDMYAPIRDTHRITLEQMAILEPAMVETLAQTCMEVVREGYDRIVALGVPEAAARDFVLGHLRIQIAVLFKEVNGSFSDAAYKISKRAKPLLFRDNWERIFDMDDIREQVRDITTK